MDLFSTKVAHAGIDSFISSVNENILNPLIVLLFALAIVYFLFGVFQFIAGQDNEQKKTDGKSHMLWGIVGLVVMMGVFTILNVVMDTFNIEGINVEEGTVELPNYNP